jgi:mRNA interferase MazF
MTGSAYVPASGDLIWTDFDPAKGREQAGRRPALVVSAMEFTGRFVT